MQPLLCLWLRALLRPGGWELQPTALAGMLDGGSQEPSAGRDGGGGAQRCSRAATLLATHCRGGSLWDVERSRKSSEHPRKAWETADFEEKPKYILPLRGLFSSMNPTLGVFSQECGYTHFLTLCTKAMGTFLKTLYLSHLSSNNCHYFGAFSLIMLCFHFSINFS